MLYFTCDYILENYKKCLKINIEIFGKERGPSMCQNVKDWYDFCLPKNNIFFNPKITYFLTQK